MTISADQIFSELKAFSNPERVKYSANFFPRHTGERKDLFFGGSVPETRKIAKKYQNIEYSQLEILFNSDYHEMRLCGLMILRLKLNKALKFQDQNQIDFILDFYKEHLNAVDHWDLVDESAASILGRVLVYNTIQATSIEEFQRIPDYKDPANGFPTLDWLAHSPILWHKRISIISQFAFIKNKNFSLPVSVCKFHLTNHHHYIQKATGWVLRELGKSDKQLLDQFINENINDFGSICLSYALEKHTKEEKVTIRAKRKIYKLGKYSGKLNLLNKQEQETLENDMKTFRNSVNLDL